MRRKDREMDETFGLTIIDKAEYGIISLSIDANESFALPLTFVRNEKVLYFHSATKGRKVECFEKEPQVTVVFVGDTHIPSLYTEEEIVALSNDADKAKNHVSRIFTTEFESAIVKGNIKIVTNDEEKILALRLLCEKYAADKMILFENAIKTSLSSTNVYTISIKAISAKRKKYNPLTGKELKWQATE